MRSWFEFPILSNSAFTKIGCSPLVDRSIEVGALTLLGWVDKFLTVPWNGSELPLFPNGAAPVMSADLIQNVGVKS